MYSRSSRLRLPECSVRPAARRVERAAAQWGSPPSNHAFRPAPRMSRANADGLPPEGVARARSGMHRSHSHGRATSGHLRPPRRPPPRPGRHVPPGRPFAAQTLCPTGGGGPRRRYVPGCGPEGRGFESPRSPQVSRRFAVAMTPPAGSRATMPTTCPGPRQDGHSGVTPGGADNPGFRQAPANARPGLSLSSGSRAGDITVIQNSSCGAPLRPVVAARSPRRRHHTARSCPPRTVGRAGAPGTVKGAFRVVPVRSARRS